MKRKLTALLLVTVLILGLCPAMELSARAEEAVQYDIVHNVNGGTLYFHSETGTIVDAVVSGAVNIPAEIQGHPVRIIGRQAFYRSMERNKITSVTIPEGVTTIESAAFSWCQNLLQVDFPSTLRRIENDAFYRSAVQKAIIPEGVEYIGDEAFGYSYLKEVSLPNGLSSMGVFVFANCASLHTVTLGENITRIEQGAFSKCEKLANVQWPSALVEIGAKAFADCKALTAVELPQGVKLLGEGAFQGCTALEKVTLPEDMTEIGDYAFSGCKNIPEIRLPLGLKRIGNGAFSNNYKLAPVTLPEGLEEIGNSAFAVCKRFTHIDFPESLRIIGDSAFSSCPLTEVDLPESLEKMGRNAFYGCTEIVAYDNGLYLDGWFVGCDSGAYTVYIKEGTVGVAGGSLKLYYEYNQEGQLNIHTVYIPASVRHIDRDAFGDTNKIGSIAVDNNNPYYSDYTDILYNKDKTELIFCGAWVFMKNVTFPTTLKRIGERAFHCCSNLEAVTLPNSVEVIGKKAFSSCPITVAHFGNSLRLIDDGAFLGSNELECVYFSGDAPQLGEQVFDSSPDVMLFYSLDKEGWTSPRWNGYLATGLKDGIQVSDFSDVSPDAYYAEAVSWAVAGGITNGTGYGTFSPENGCIRGQVVTFLWRAAGCPDPEGTENPFVDIYPTDYYYKAVLWAVEQGITTGTGDQKFSPYHSCTRGQIVTFLWRAFGKPQITMGENPFQDVSTEAYYYDAVLWAVEQGITTGMSANTFAPEKTCTRGQIVTFLYRAYN